MPPSTPKKNRRWIWFFVVVGVLALGAFIGLVVFNILIQLKPETFATARKLWSDHGPRDYTLTYTIRVNEEPDSDHYWVKVRQGRVVESKYNGQAEPPARYPYRGMDGLFNFIEKFMQIDSEPKSAKTYVRGIFDDQKIGALRWYVRRVMGGRQRVEITVNSLVIDAP